MSERFHNLGEVASALDYALVGLTVPELAAVRDAVARDVDERRRRQEPIPPRLRDALDKLTRYHDARAKGL